jgi:hypothetical protein
VQQKLYDYSMISSASNWIEFGISSRAFISWRPPLHRRIAAAAAEDHPERRSGR